MSVGLTPNLLLITIFTFTMCFWISSRILKVPWALLISLFKAAIPLIYFSYFFDGTWTFLDDITYQKQGSYLIELGFNPVNILLSKDGIVTLIKTSGGMHFLYGWFNLTAQYLFGEYYYSPVFINTILSVLGALIFFKTLRLLKFSESYSKAFFIFFLFHWEIIPWSSFTNLKDILVMDLTILSFFFIIKTFSNFKFIYILGFLFSLFLLTWIRYYIPIIILAAVALWAFLHWKNKKKLLIFPIIAALAIILLYSKRSGLLLLEPYSLADGFIHFILTPQPWSIEDDYGFLFIPSILHWVFIIPILISSFWLWKQSTYSKLLIIYLLLTTTLNSMYPALQGPRHRLQVVFIYAWMQFHFLWVIFYGALKKMHSPLISHLKPSNNLT